MPPTPVNKFSENLQTWTTILALVVAVLSIFAGIQLARGNSDIVCSTSVSDSGACSNGNWSAWATVSKDDNQLTERRTYTGLRNIISGSFSISGNIHALNYCNNFGAGSLGGAGGTITSQNSACQIEETRVRSIGGGQGGPMTTISQTQQESTGNVVESTASQGIYQDYLNMIDARLATSSIRVMPTLVREGETTQVVWTSSHVKSCSVQGTNSDAWTGGSSGADGEKSSPITAQTVYTLACLTALGNTVGGQAIVNIIPTFMER